ncbi:MAG: cytochrome c, class [Bryobacterales bacterium]|nr:cytochrome c, class [Bryobacterales bacterium]
MLSPVRSRILVVFAGGLALFAIMTRMEAQAPAAAAAGRGAAGRGGGRLGRFKVYTPEAVSRGLAAYNSSCGYCHGERGKGGKAGPDLIASVTTLHDEDGVEIAKFVRGEQHAKAGKVDATDAQIADIASYLHSRVIYASGRGDIRMAEVLVGNAKAGEQYFNGAGGCNKCHSPAGDLKGVAGKYDVATLQERLVMPRAGRGGFGRGATAPNPTAPFATVTLASGEAIKGAPLRVTDFDVTLRLADGSTKTWARNRGIPKVEITDPLQSHIDIMTRLADSDMHNLTAYLAGLK